MNNRQCESGFTLLELLVGLLVLGIVMTLVVPAFGQLVTRNRLATTTNQLLLAMTTARTLAVGRNTPVVFCAGNDTEGCHGDWSRSEWIAFADHDRSRNLSAADSMQIIERFTGRPSLQLSANGPFRREVIFRASGLAQTRTGAFAAGRVRICADGLSGDHVNDLVLIGSGRAVLERHDFAGACVPP